MLTLMVAEEAEQDGCLVQVRPRKARRTFQAQFRGGEVHRFGASDGLSPAWLLGQNLRFAARLWARRTLGSDDCIGLFGTPWDTKVWPVCIRGRCMLCQGCVAGDGVHYHARGKWEASVEGAEVSVADDVFSVLSEDLGEDLGGEWI